jgi:hypothetical protein
LREHVGIVPSFAVSEGRLIIIEPSMLVSEILFWVFTGIAVLIGIGVVVGVIKSMAMRK